MTLTELVATFGPTAGVLLYLVMNRPKPDAKADPMAELLTELREMRRDMGELSVRLARLEGKVE